jgi:hypothetical protein
VSRKGGREVEKEAVVVVGDEVDDAFGFEPDDGQARGKCFEDDLALLEVSARPRFRMRAYKGLGVAVAESAAPGRERGSELTRERRSSRR